MKTQAEIFAIALLRARLNLPYWSHNHAIICTATVVPLISLFRFSEPSLPQQLKAADMFRIWIDSEGVLLKGQ